MRITYPSHHRCQGSVSKQSGCNCALVGILALLAIGWGLSAEAHWEVENETFPWAMPGQVRWLIDYSKMEEPHVRKMLEARFNVIQGGSFSPDALQLIRSTPDVHAMQYICCRTIYHERLFKSNPELREAAIRNPDGSYKVIYNNPARYAGCFNCDAWLKYIETQMVRLRNNGIKTIFFDNPMTWACYCPVCQERFRSYAREKTGQEWSLGQSGGSIELERWFTIDTAQQWFEQIRARAHRNGMLIVANNLNYWLVARGVTDGVFSESYGHAPFAQDIASYKIGLAASHGKPTGVLDFVPGTVLRVRGKPVSNKSNPNQTGGSGTRWVGAPVAEEYEVGYAQGLACGGNYLANYSIGLGRRIELGTDPEDSRIQASLVKYGAFAAQHPEIYARAVPGAAVGVLYSLAAGPRTGAILGTSRGDMNKVLWTLVAGGVPADVVVEDDLTPQRLVGVRALVVDNVAVLDPEAATGLAAFVSNGGTLVLTAPGEVRSRHEIATAARSLGDYLTDLPRLKAEPRPSKAPAKPNSTATAADASGIVRFQMGKGVVLQLARPLAKATAAEREEILAALRPLCPVWAAAGQWPEKLLVNVTHAAPGGPRCVHLVNYDFQYDKQYALQAIRPADKVAIQVREVKRAKLISPDGAAQTLPVAGGKVELPPIRVYSVVVLE